jgi:predicted TIM-barrel fold metal-dependent hydrolase
MVRHFDQANRRRFLQICGATAACGLTHSSRASALRSPLVDTHVYLGRWPLRRLSDDTPAALAAQLRGAGVTRAWAGSFEGLFHKDTHAANMRLVEACRNAPHELFIPIGAVNPTLPDWEEDVRRCRETFKMRGIRLHPTYHGYTLDDPRFTRLLEIATKLGLFVQLVVQMTNERQRHLTPRDAQVNLAPLLEVAPRMPDLRLVISNLAPLADDLLKPLATQTHTYWELPRTAEVPALRRLIGLVSADRIVLGSSAPLSNDVENGIMPQSLGMTAEQLNAIRSGNTERILAPTRTVR